MAGASQQQLNFLKEQMAGFGPVEVRRMFGGAGLFRDGMMFALVAEDTLYFKSDAESAPAFEAEQLRPFSYATKTGEHTLTSYRRAPERCLDDEGEMTQWSRLAWGAALRKAAATAKPKKKPPKP